MVKELITVPLYITTITTQNKGTVIAFSSFSVTSIMLFDWLVSLPINNHLKSPNVCLFTFLFTCPASIMIYYLVNTEKYTSYFNKICQFFSILTPKM